MSGSLTLATDPTGRDETASPLGLHSIGEGKNHEENASKAARRRPKEATVSFRGGEYKSRDWALAKAVARERAFAAETEPGRNESKEKMMP